MPLKHPPFSFFRASRANGERLRRRTINTTPGMQIFQQRMLMSSSSGGGGTSAGATVRSNTPPLEQIFEADPDYVTSSTNHHHAAMALNDPRPLFRTASQENMLNHHSTCSRHRCGLIVTQHLNKHFFMYLPIHTGNNFTLRHLHHPPTLPIPRTHGTRWIFRVSATPTPTPTSTVQHSFRDDLRESTGSRYGSSQCSSFSSMWLIGPTTCFSTRTAPILSVCLESLPPSLSMICFFTHCMGQQ